uniref:Uncharacterized protein n=1 Tax=Pararge aegeria TaxID=116150 RepID=S4NHS2_9NEOP
MGLQEVRTNIKYPDLLLIKELIQDSIVESVKHAYSISHERSILWQIQQYSTIMNRKASLGLPIILAVC